MGSWGNELSAMTFRLIGVNHKSAPIEVREKLAIPEARLAEVRSRLAEHPGGEEAMILLPSHRVELLARTTNGAADLRGFLRTQFGADAAALNGCLYEKDGKE